LIFQLIETGNGNAECIAVCPQPLIEFSVVHIQPLHFVSDAGLFAGSISCLPEQ
jgi:hypothetical protein